MANKGRADGIAGINGNAAVCALSAFGDGKITIKFIKPGALKVTQNGTDAKCGFGRNRFGERRLPQNERREAEI